MYINLVELHVRGVRGGYAIHRQIAAQSTGQGTGEIARPFWFQIPTLRASPSWLAPAGQGTKQEKPTQRREDAKTPRKDRKNSASLRFFSCPLYKRCISKELMLGLLAERRAMRYNRVCCYETSPDGYPFGRPVKCHQKPTAYWTDSQQEVRLWGMVRRWSAAMDHQ